jgi:sugar lactone lactonase YvrE
LKGNVYLALRDGNTVYRIDAADNHIHRVAGTGQRGYSGDGGPARSARLSGPKGLAWAPDNSLYIADTENNAIRRVDLKTAIISTVAGAGDRGDGPDGDPLKCKLARPHGVCAGRRGAIFIADSENHRIRMLREIPPPPPLDRPARQKSEPPPPGDDPRKPKPAGEKSFTPSRRIPPR